MSEGFPATGPAGAPVDSVPKRPLAVRVSGLTRFHMATAA